MFSANGKASVQIRFGREYNTIRRNLFSKTSRSSIFVLLFLCCTHGKGTLWQNLPRYVALVPMAIRYTSNAYNSEGGLSTCCFICIRQKIACDRRLILLTSIQVDVKLL